MNKSIVTSVAAMGEAETEYDLAHFTISLFVDGETSAIAKDRLKDRADGLTRAIAAILDSHSAMIVAKSLKTQVNVSPTYQWDENAGRNVPSGYRGVYTYQFKTDAMAKISKVYEELVVLHNVQVAAPIFFLKNEDALNRDALKNAWGKVKERFVEQCEILGKNPGHFEIASWQTDYSDAIYKNKSHKQAAAPQALRAMDADEADVIEPIEIVIGSARVTMNLSVSFTEKE